MQYVCVSGLCFCDKFISMIRDCQQKSCTYTSEIREDSCVEEDQRYDSEKIVRLFKIFKNINYFPVNQNKITTETCW